jgi:3',5'-cyclic AMP phosphodiesterase CpdA
MSKQHLILLALFSIVIVTGCSLIGDAPRRGPYLQSVTADSVWIVWDTSQPTAGRLEYGLTTELGQVAEESHQTTHHELQLTGLQAYTTYTYRVDGGQLASFHTAASPARSSFHFAVYGDTRSGGAVHRKLTRRIVDTGPDFVLHTGDMVEFGANAAEWDDFFRIAAPLLRIAPLYPNLGNHEDQHANYFDAFHLPGNERYYTFDYGNARFICLKVDGYSPEGYFPEKEQMDWLEAQLAANDKPWLFVFFHIALYTSREEPGFLEVGVRSRLEPLFEQYGVDAIFMGHAHSYERILVNGITYIVAAGGGAPLYELVAPEPGSQAAASVYHYVLIEIDGEQLTGTAIDAQGEVIDSFTLTANR